MRPQRFDVIIIGGGSAGCTIAARLSEDPGRQVLLLEAGPDPQPIPDSIKLASREARSLMESPHIVMYPTVRKGDGSTFYKVSGRVMGGGSSVNAMAAIRPTRSDLDRWASLGNPGWSFDECLPLLKRIETDADYPDSPIHGSDGPLYVKRPFILGDPADEPAAAFIERAMAMGLPLCADLNVPDPFGVCTAPYNIKDGIRQSTTVAYLDPARGRPNLHIVDEAIVTSLKITGDRVEQVVYEKDGQSQSASGERVVLCAGAYQSPQILMLSGIGPAAELKRLGIDVKNALAGVGENYQDHATVSMTFEGRSDFRPDWVIPRFRLMFKSDPSFPCGNFHITQRPPTRVEGLAAMMPVSASLVEQRARGRLRLVSTDPHELLEIDDAMLVDPDDRKAVATAMQFIYDLVQHPSMEGFYGPIIYPGSDDDWEQHARNTHGTYHHGVGTCMMGPASDPMAVVDSTLRVHGMENLWVADASIMPTVTHANTNLTTIMIGERLSDLLKEA
ncbi:MAG: FAD-dependent oxidoreductase [Chloroflexi bacterium]|nr:FAD-dependent oxidoreductase [Chloroflexota bacterium]